MESIYRYINVAANKQRRWFASHSSLEKLSGAKEKILHYLLTHQEEAVYQKMIEEEFGLRPPTATQLLKSMEDDGLIIKKARDGDARFKVLTVTPEGEKHRDQLESKMQELTQTLIQDIPTEDLEIWSRVMQKIIKNLE